MRRAAGDGHADILNVMDSSLKATNLLWVWHVGARGGYIPVSFPGFFDPGVGLLMIDADPAAGVERCVPQLVDGRYPNCKAQGLCAAAWETDARVDIHFTACPFASGTRRLDPRFRDWFVFGNGDLDYVLGPAHHAARSCQVQARRLDSIAAELEGQVAAPAILTIDAKGASAEILRGARRLLAKSVDAVICEAETIPFYGGTPSLSTILADMSDAGFRFSGFLENSDAWASPCRNPVGLRGRPLQGSVDAVFIRDPSDIGIGADPRRAAAYAFVACAVGHPDLAVWALSRSQGQYGRSPVELFASALCESAQAMGKSLPPAFGATCSGTAGVTALADPSESAFERCLATHGFTELASEVRARRLFQAPFAHPFAGPESANRGS